MAKAKPDIFALNARLKADSAFVAALPLCDMRLMREERWFWLLLVPRLPQAEEVFDLTAPQQAELMAELAFAARLLRQTAACDKINIGALGNKVRQLHIHIVARAENDHAWPEPVWGQGARQEPPAERHNARFAAIKAALAALAPENGQKPA